VDHQEVAAPPSSATNERSFGFKEWKENLKALRDHKRVTTWSFIVLTMLINFGFDAVISGQALAFLQFRKDYGTYYAPMDDYIVDALWQSLWSAASSLGVVMGSLLAGFTNDRFGRKLAFYIHILSSIASSFILVFAPNVQTLFAAKLVFGITIGMAYTTVPLYVVENAPTQIRGVLMSMFNIFIVVGQFLATLVANPLSKIHGSWSYKGTFCLTFLVPAILIFVVPLVPESPVWYAMRNRDDDARKAIARLHGNPEPQFIQERMVEIQSMLQSSASSQEGQRDASFLEIFQGSNLRRTILMLTIYALQHCSGMPFVLNYQAYFFDLSGISNPFAVSVGSFALMLAGSLGALLLPDLVGQRNIMVYGATLLIVWDIIIGGMGFAGTHNRAAVLVSVVFVASWAFVYQLTLGTVGFVVAPEMPTQRLRAKTQSVSTAVANIVGWAISFSIPYLV
jgi:sugar porter (SP) family MFS transporter